MIWTFFARISLNLLLISSVLLLACSDNSDETAKFIQNIASACKGLKAGQHLRMDEINQAEWDQMYIFAPYTPLTEIEAAIRKKAASVIRESRISERDDINLFVFLKNEDIQFVVAVPRKVIDVSVVKEVQPVSRNGAVFRSVGPGGAFILANSK